MRPRKFQARVRLAIVLLLLAIATAFGPLACGDDGRTIDWDLSTSRSRSGVGWKDSSDTRLTINNVRRARIRLPDGLLIDERHGMLVEATRRGDQIADITLQFPDENAEAAHRRAKSLAESYQLERGIDSIDHFLETDQQRRAAGQEYSEEPFEGGVTASNRDLASDQEPRVSVTIDYNFDEDRPWDVQLRVRFTPE